MVHVFNNKDAYLPILVLEKMLLVRKPRQIYILHLHQSRLSAAPHLAYRYRTESVAPSPVLKLLEKYLSTQLLHQK